MNDGAGTKLFAGGAIGAAIASSICCIGPLVLAILGLGGGAVLLRLEPYRPYFLVATGAFIAVGFYLTYRRAESEHCEPGTSCENPAGRRDRKIILWIVTGFVLLLATFPYYSKYLL